MKPEDYREIWNEVCQTVEKHHVNFAYLVGIKTGIWNCIVADPELTEGEAGMLMEEIKV